jgi:hypothetical protein
MSDASPRLPFESDDAVDPSLVTGRAGVPLVIELFRQRGVAQAIDTEVTVKQRQRGLPPSQLVESLIALWTSGGDRCQDLTPLREDRALTALLGHPPPATTTVRDVLEAVHVEGGPLWAAGPQATIPEETAPLVGLGRANRTLVAGLQRGARARTATLDVDATLVESHKAAATVAYDGTRGYQPEVLRWCEDPQHPVAYAISADLSAQLKAEIVRLPETAWQVEREEPDAIRAWAEVVVRPERWRPPEGSALCPPVPRGADPQAARESLRGREQRALLRRGHEPD